MRLAAENVRKSYGSVTALDGLSLTIDDGTTFGVLGTNGAGKSTLFRLFVGLETPDSGRLTIGGQDVVGAGHAIRERVGYLPERIGFPSLLTGREVLEFHCRMRGLARDRRIDEAVDTVGLTRSDADRPVQGYSNGMRRRLGLAATILPRPEVLILDEPTAGLDPRGVAEFHHIVKRARDKTDATVIIASHVLSEVQRLCDRVAILDNGRTVASGPVGELVDAEKMQLRLQPQRHADLEKLAGICAGFGTVHTRHGAVEVDLVAGELPALFARLDDQVPIARTAVQRGGLETAFLRAIGAVDIDNDDIRSGEAA